MKRLGRVFKQYKDYIYPVAVGALILVIIVLVARSWSTAPLDGKSDVPAFTQEFVLGSPSAPVTIIEYSDFQCYTCVIFAGEVFPSLKLDYIDKGKVKFIYRDFILYGNDSIRIANAARCAGEQGQFWDYHDLLFSGRSAERGAPFFTTEELKNFGKKLILNNDQFNACVDALKYKEAIKASDTQARAAGVIALPSFFINKIGPVSGSLRYRHFKPIIDAALKQAY